LFKGTIGNTQLSANAQIFYRQKVVKDKVFKEGYENKQYIFDLKRFVEEKFLFHLPISLNAYSVDGISKGAPNGLIVKNLNQKVNDIFLKEKRICFLGIDRGEKHLAYYYLVDENGNIIF